MNPTQTPEMTLTAAREKWAQDKIGKTLATPLPGRGFFEVKTFDLSENGAWLRGEGKSAYRPYPKSLKSVKPEPSAHAQACDRRRRARKHCSEVRARAAEFGHNLRFNTGRGPFKGSDDIFYDGRCACGLQVCVRIGYTDASQDGQVSLGEVRGMPPFRARCRNTIPKPTFATRFEIDSEMLPAGSAGSFERKTRVTLAFDGRRRKQLSRYLDPAETLDLVHRLLETIPATTFGYLTFPIDAPEFLGQVADA
jgi:hypothetical protein